MAFFQDLFRDGAEIDCNNPYHDATTFTLALLLTVGMAASYIPQHARIIRLRSSKGLSGSYLLLGGIAMSSLMLNSFLLQFENLKCCAVQVRFPTTTH